MNSSVLLLLLFAMMTGAQANPMPMGNTTAMPDTLSILMQKMMLCIQPVRMQKDVTHCLKQFYQSFRANPNQDCPQAAMTMMPACINGTTRKCLVEAGISEAMIGLIPGSNAPAIIDANTTAMFCSTIVPFRLVPFTNCSTNYHMSLFLCMPPFQQKFNANKGDPALCEAYEVQNSCLMAAAKTNCDATEYRNISTEFAFLNEKKYNPFCSDAQVAASNGSKATLVPMVNTTIIPGLNMMQMMMQCMQPVRMRKDVTHCLKELYQSFRANPNQDCPQAGIRMVPGCISVTLTKCLAEAGAPEAMATMISSSTASAIFNANNAARFCSGIVPLRATMFTNCSQNYNMSRSPCMPPFQQKFNANKGDPSLCDAYTTMDNCTMAEAKMHCDMAEYRNISTEFAFFNKKKYNPFCSDSQVNGTVATPAGSTATTPAGGTAATLVSGMLLSVFAVLFGVGTFW